MSEKTYRRAVPLLEAEVDHELVALEPDGGNCFGFNRVATAVWRKLEQPRSFDQLKDDLMEKFDVGSAQCASELQELLDRMQIEGLIDAA